MFSLKKKKEDEDVKIKNLIELDEYIERFRQNKLDLLNPNIVYKKAKFI